MLTPRAIKRLFIVGPTATGKTNIALSISRQIPSVLFSADSRQVYRGMDVVTGKDHPNNIELSGIDIASPDESCSVAQWQESIDMDLEYAETTGKLPIFVGGTGLFIKSMIEPIITMGIPVDDKLRKSLNILDVTELQNKLRKLDPARLYAMNNSDSHNLRRLIRAIEVAQFGKEQLKEFHYERPNIFSQLIIGLRITDTSIYESRVRNRVIERIKNGAIEETQKLLEQYSPSLPSMTALGYKHIISYINNHVSKEQMIDNWTREEVAYAKRQMTWFNKMENILWFDVSDKEFAAKVEEQVKTWYH